MLQAADSGVTVLVVLVLTRGTFYASRVSERAPQVVYGDSLEEVESDSQESLQININPADIEKLDELPEVGPATAECGGQAQYEAAGVLERPVQGDYGDHRGLARLPGTIQQHPVSLRA